MAWIKEIIPLRWILRILECKLWINWHSCWTYIGWFGEVSGRNEGGAGRQAKVSMTERLQRCCRHWTVAATTHRQSHQEWIVHRRNGPVRQHITDSQTHRARHSQDHTHSSRIRFLRFFSKSKKTRPFTVLKCHFKKRKKRRKRCPGFHSSPPWNC